MLCTYYPLCVYVVLTVIVMCMCNSGIFMTFVFATCNIIIIVELFFVMYMYVSFACKYKQNCAWS